MHSHISLCPWTYAPVIRGPTTIHPHQVKDNSIYRREERFSLFMNQQKASLLKTNVQNAHFTAKLCRRVPHEILTLESKPTRIYLGILQRQMPADDYYV